MSSQALACAISLCEVSLDPLSTEDEPLANDPYDPRHYGGWFIGDWQPFREHFLKCGHQITYIRVTWGVDVKCRAPGCDPPLSPPHSSNPMGLERGLKNASFLSTSSPGVILHTDAPGPLLWDVSSSCPGKSVTNAQGYPLTGRQRMNEQMSSFLLKGLRWGGVSHKTLTGEKKPRQRQAIQMWHQLLAQKKQARVWIEDTCFKPQKLDISTLARLADHVVLIMLLTLNVFAWPYQAL